MLSNKEKSQCASQKWMCLVIPAADINCLEILQFRWKKLTKSISCESYKTLHLFSIETVILNEIKRALQYIVPWHALTSASVLRSRQYHTHSFSGQYIHHKPVVHHFEGIHLLIGGPAGNWTSGLTSTDARPYQIGYTEHSTTYSVCECGCCHLYYRQLCKVCVCVCEREREGGRERGGDGKQKSPCWLPLTVLVWWTTVWAEPYYFIITCQKALLHINPTSRQGKQTHAWLRWLLQSNSWY